jgi:hypothetical protein
LFKFVMELDVISAHLVPHEIRLIPWVESRDVASRSRQRSNAVWRVEDDAA